MGDKFGLARMVIGGDRGMITTAPIDALTRNQVCFPARTRLCRGPIRVSDSNAAQD